MTAPARPIRPSGLTVLYDATCPICRRARSWVENQQRLVPVRFVTAGSEDARRRFPGIDVASTLTDVTVITDEGAVLRGENAWIAVLWAVARTRPTANAIAQGRRRLLFRSVVGATEAIRRAAAGQPDPRSPWPAPTGPCAGDHCRA